MTRLVICKKCWKIFFTNKKSRSGLQCPQRNCLSKNVISLSARFINEYGLDFVIELIDRGKPLDTVKYRTIADIPPKIVSAWFSKYYRNREPELNIKWLMAHKSNLSRKDVYSILNILYDHSGYGNNVRGSMSEYRDDPESPVIKKSQPEPKERYQKEPEYRYCYYALWCNDSRKNLNGNTRNCSNKNNDNCYETAKRKYLEEK